MQPVENKRFVYRFERFVLDPNERTLFSEGVPIHLPAKEFDTLLLLVENNGKALSKDEMMTAVWHDAFVEESNLAKQISRLRKLFNSDGEVTIETLPKHGYRFSADVKRIVRSEDQAIFEKRTLKRLTVNFEEDDEIDESPHALPPKKRISATAFVVAVLVILIGLVGSWLWLARNGTKKIGSIAVLPLRSLTDDESNKALGLGLADALIMKIGGLRQIVVRPVSSVAVYTDATQDALEIGKKLKADAVLEGTIQRTNGQIRINARLLRVENGEQIWAERFDGESANIFDLENRLAEGTLRALKLSLGASESERIARRDTENRDAFDDYLKGRYLWNRRTEQDLKDAIVFFNQAIEKDQNYARAYSGLADCYILLGIWGSLRPNEAMPKAKEAALMALKADDSLADAHTSLAFIKWVYDWDQTAADNEFQTALRLNPNYSTAHHWYAYFLAATEQFDRSIAHIKQAHEIEGSLSLSISTDIGEIYCWARRYDESITQLKEMTRIAPDFAPARNALGIAYLKTGQIPEAITEFETARRLHDGPSTIALLGYAFGISGQREKALEIVADLNKLSETRYIKPFWFAVVYSGIGDNDEALKRLEEAFNERSDTMAILRVYPLIQGLHPHPRFIRLQERIGL